MLGNYIVKYQRIINFSQKTASTRLFSLFMPVYILTFASLINEMRIKKNVGLKM